MSRFSSTFSASIRARVLGALFWVALSIAVISLIPQYWLIAAIHCPDLGLNFRSDWWANRDMILIISAAATVIAGILHRRHEHLLSRHLVSRRVRKQRYSNLNRLDAFKKLISRFKIRIRRPGPAAFASVVALLLGIFIIQLVSWCQSGPIDGSDSYQALWQVQAGFASAAIPILLFVIRRSKSDSDHYGSDVPVLIRYTWIYPLMLFAMGGVIVTTIGARWLMSQAGFVVSFCLLAVTVIGTIYAFRTLLLLLSDESQLERATHRYIAEQFRTSLHRGADRYLGALAMIRVLTSLGAGYSPIMPVQNDQYTKIPLYSTGRITEVDLAKLHDFLRSLPWQAHHQPDIVESGSLPEPADEPPSSDISRVGSQIVAFRKLFGDRIQEKEPVVFLKTNAFDELDVSTLSSLLENAFSLSRE